MGNSTNRNLLLFLFTSFFIFLTLYFFVEENKKNQPLTVNQGNQKIRSFRYAKKLANRFYEQHNFKTFYCGCTFNHGDIDHSSCDYRPIRPKNRRSRRLEWEHVVPISYLGRNLPSWKHGHSRCRKKNGRTYKGRKCASKVSKVFRKMEADLYNLVPSVGEVNELRENFPVGLVKKEESYQFNCDTKIRRGLIEPRDEVKGFFARIYLYMHKAYPGNNIINKRNRELIEKWNKKYPPSLQEKLRNSYIEKVQGNSLPKLEQQN